MPVALLCLDCHAPITTGSRCPSCAATRMVKRPHGYRSKNATARGYTSQWQRVVRIAIARQPWCSACGATTDLTGDHIIPLSKGGDGTLDNLRVLCRSCNSRRGNR